MEEFTHTSSGWVHEELAEARANAERVVEQRRQAGQASARKRNGMATSVPTTVERTLNYNTTVDEGKKPIRKELSQETSVVIPIGEARK